MTAPIGTIISFAGDLGDLTGTGNALAHQLAASGWLPCIGQTLTAADYPDLHQQIVRICQAPFGARAQTVYQPSDTQFRLPDLRGNFLRAIDGSNFSGEEVEFTTGRPASTQFVSDRTGSHSHVASPRNDTTHSQDIRAAGTRKARAHTDGGGKALTQTGGNHDHKVTGGGDAETRPGNVAVEYLIKVR